MGNSVLRPNGPVPNLPFSVFLLLLLLGSLCNISAQQPSFDPIYRNINADTYCRLAVDNDYFTGTDQQYTEGFNLSLVAPWIAKFPLTKLLVHPNLPEVKYGVSVYQAGYTPRNLSDSQIAYGDRPFSGTLFLNTSLIATDSILNQRFCSSLSTGILGPGSGTDKLQANIHVAIANVNPPGWKYQLRNELIVNYSAAYECKIANYSDKMIAVARAAGNVGSLYNNIGGGITAMAGIFESPFGKRNPLKFQLYVFAAPQFSFVFYDATLQGGIFHSDNPYTIATDKISRIVFISHSGLGFSYKKLKVEYSETFTSNLYKNGPVHLFGTIQVALAFAPRR
jgi:hypothetical protein